MITQVLMVYLKIFILLEIFKSDLNDFIKRKNISDLNSFLFYVMAYVKNHGNTDLPVFKKFLERICYEHKEILNLDRIGNLR